MRSIAAGATCALLAGQLGCAQHLATNVAATGEPLSVEFASTYRQGKNPIDEHDFFRIAGDRQATAQIEHQRGRGIFYNRVGLILAGIGLTGLVVASTTDGAVARTGTGATLLLPLGGVMAFYGRNVAEEHGIVDAGRAREAANRYNARTP